MSDLTPLMRQYSAIKDKYKDCLLFFRLGDFYEMFFDDAVLASRELQITLTGRGVARIGGIEKRVPMCGVPHHAASGYVAKLLHKGYRVAVCEQTEDPALAKGLTKREVVRVLTPGTVLEEEILPSYKNNYLVVLTFEVGDQTKGAKKKNGSLDKRDKEAGFEINSVGLACLDASTGEFQVAKIAGEQVLEKTLAEVARLSPAEVLLPGETAELIVAGDKPTELAEFLKDTQLLAFFQEKGFSLGYYDPAVTFDARGQLSRFFRVAELGGFGLEKTADWDQAAGAAWLALDYLARNQKTTLAQIRGFKTYRLENYMYLDAAARRHLELVQTWKDGRFEGSLLWVLDQTKTAMGTRLLRRWVEQPLLDREEILKRQEAVAELAADTAKRSGLAELLDQVADISRLIARTAAQTAGARDLVSLKESLSVLPKVREILKNAQAGLLRTEALSEAGLTEVTEIISRAIVESPPPTIKNGGLIADGYNTGLDDLKRSVGEGKDWIAGLETSERQRTGIKSLKVGYNKVFGYYIEVSNTNLGQVPDNYIRKQTLTNGERFITPELKEKETLILNSQQLLADREYEIFLQVREKVASYTDRIQAAGQALACLDCLVSLAKVAVENRYCRPQIPAGGQTVGPDLVIREGRHPVLEKTLAREDFVPNDTVFETTGRIHLLTGPNMAGKSTYMRQVALIILLAQIGSFVPAREAVIPLVDRIFTRVGAIDDLFGGKSTFMMEMVETANILNNATADSLIILDEIGRGTSTYDGMAIARAVVEYISQNIGGRTFFATHYHELTNLAESLPGIKNYNAAVVEERGRVIFLHRVLPGKADKSYGIHVAQMAGLPTEVVKRADKILADLEAGVEQPDKRQLGLF